VTTHFILERRRIDVEFAMETETRVLLCSLPTAVKQAQV